MENKAWEPTNVEAFKEAYLRGESDNALAVKFDGTYNRVRKYIKRKRDDENWPSRKALETASVTPTKGVDIGVQFVQFLSKARTRLEMETKFGGIVDALLSQDFPGYNFFEDRNIYGTPVWALLPEIRQTFEVQPRIWSFYAPTSDQGDFPQGYLKVQMPTNVFQSLPSEDVELRLVPLFDVHFGHHAHKHDKFLAYLKYITETPNVFVWGGGDLLENALDDGRGMTYEQSHHPAKQIDTVIELLAPIAHKIFFLQPGNHEWRSYNKTGIEPTMVICRELKIPYFDGPVILDILGVGHRWRIHSQHGKTNAGTKGGKMNAAGAPRKWTNGVHFFVSGHVHDPIVNSETVMDVCPVESRIKYTPQFTVVCPSFLGYEGTYAQRTGYPPPGLGGVSLSLYASGKYEARLHNDK